MGEDATGRPSGRRLTVDEAARALGLSVDAIRKRVQRGTIPHEKDGAGRVRIILDSPDDNSTLRDERPDTTGRDELVEELRDRVRALERRLDEEQEARRRTDTILAQLARANEEQARTIRELEAPSEPRESPAPSGPGPTPPEGSGEAQGATERPEEPRRSWWRRWLG